MEDQLTLMNESDKQFKIGDEITGDIISIAKDHLVVSLVGYKSDAIIPFKELTSEDNLDEFLKSVSTGSEITAKIIKLKNDDNYVVLSRLEYEKKKVLRILKDKFDNKETFEITIKDANKSGLIAYFENIRVFVPTSQISSKFINKFDDFIGKTINVRLIEFVEGRTPKIIASSRILMEEKEQLIENEVWGNLSLGDIITVEVKRFTKFGAFAEYKGVDGLLHLSEISWKHIKSPEEILKIGEKINVKVINLDKENKKLSFSLKQTTVEPWSLAEEKYPIGSAVLGKVVRINDFGAFVELESGLDGLVHISKLSHNHVKHPSEVLNVGDEIKCIILEVNKETKKLALSMKDAE